MLQVCPSSVRPNESSSFIAAMASSRILTAPGRSVYRSKSKCTSSKAYSRAGGGGGETTRIVVVSEAVPPRPSSTVTVTGTGPSADGAVQVLVIWSLGLSVPVGAAQRYVRGSPSGSFALAVTVDVSPGATSQGSHIASTVGGRLAGGSGRGAAGSGAAGSTYRVTPG